jgi:hypothetical protein
MRALVIVALSLSSCAPSLPRAGHGERAPLAREGQPDGASREVALREDLGPRQAPDGGALDGGPSDPLLVLAAQITARVREVRGLAPRGPIASGALAREAIVARLRERVAEEYAPGELAREGLLYRGLGLWNDPRDYADTTFALLEEQVAGFYDPSRKRLHVASWLSPFTQGPTLAHEITHALQDQHFDIARFTTHRQGDGDRQLAAMSVVEGDATLAMLAFTSGRRGLVRVAEATLATMPRGGSGGERIESAPVFLRESLVFPYREGLRVCTRAYARGGWEAINAMLRDPPTSSEQILHPDKLSAREAPLDVPAAVPPSLGATHELAQHETLGEFGLQLWLRTWLPPDLSDEAAAGWGGDHAMLLVPRATPGTSSPRAPQARPATTLWVVRMDASPEDREALELERAAVGLLRRRHAGARRAPVAGVTLALATGAGTVALVARRGPTLLIAEQVPIAVAAAAAREALTASEASP